MSNKSEKNRKQKVAWFLPDIQAGSGGIRTILQNAEFLSKKGYVCDLYVSPTGSNAEAIRAILLNDYGVDFAGDIFCHHSSSRQYDIAIATYYATAKVVASAKARRKLYFIQDYEPWFFPMSENHLEAEASYSRGFQGITIGRWLTKEIRNKGMRNTNFFNFCVDLKTYHKIPEIKKEKAVCFVYQPDKPRRCAELGLRALQIVKSLCPDVKIYLFGSPEMVPFNLEAKHLGLISVEKCNELYNKCSVGLCLSSTNPSRIPFEMMAAGLPVVDLRMENNIYDFPEDGCLLADPSPESVASSIVKILNNKTLAKTLSDDGKKYMLDFPLERGFEEFYKIIESREEQTTKQIRPIYGRPVTNCLNINQKDFGPAVYFKSLAEIEQEKELARQEYERQHRNFFQKVYYKIRYILFKF